MRDYDLTTAAGRQGFERFIVELIRNEINSYAKQVLFDRNSTTYLEPTSTTTLTDQERIERLEQAIFRG
jgi:putative aminopeptidase FrvX